MKKILLGLFAITSIASFATEGYHLYGKFGGDLLSKTKIHDENLKLPQKSASSYAFLLEATTDVAPNLEVGLGTGYVIRRGKYFTGNFDYQGERVIYKGKWASYDSFPLYLTTKYNFENSSNFTPYIKADLGYSFNKVNKPSLTFNGENVDMSSFKVKNGIYVGIGAGVEYNNFIAELSYIHTSAKLKYEDDSDKFNNKAIRLSVGYKFNF